MAKKKSKLNSIRFRDTVFVELPCKKYKVYNAVSGEERGDEGMPVMIMGPAKKVARIMAKLESH